MEGKEAEIAGTKRGEWRRVNRQTRTRWWQFFKGKGKGKDDPMMVDTTRDEADEDKIPNSKLIDVTGGEEGDKKVRLVMKKFTDVVKGAQDGEQTYRT